MKTVNKNTLTFSTFNEQMVRRAFGLQQELKKKPIGGWEEKKTGNNDSDKQGRTKNT